MPDIMTAVGVSTACVAVSGHSLGNKKPHFLHQPRKALDSGSGLGGSFDLRRTGCKPEGADRPRSPHQAVGEHAALFAIGGRKLRLRGDHLSEKQIKHLAL